MRQVYFITGLGAQCRIFDRIELPEGHQRHYLEFILPDLDDDLVSYAHRLGKSILPNSVLIGLSLGGMMSTEIAKIRPDLTVILLSSIPTRQELPKYLNAILNLRLNRIINEQLLRKSLPLITKKIIANTDDPELIDYIMEMSHETDVDLYKWFTEAIKLWNNNKVPSNIIRIHGTDDRVLPIKNKHDIHYILNGGSHVMVLDRFQEINLILKHILK